MKLIENNICCGWKTYARDKEYVEYKGKRYLVTRAYAPLKCNTLTLRKQYIVDKLIKDGIDIKEISKITGVSKETIQAYWIMKFKQENYSKAQGHNKKVNYCCKKVKILCLTDNSIEVYDSVTAAAAAIECSGSNVSNYCRSGKIYRHKSTGKEYKMSFA